MSLTDGLVAYWNLNEQFGPRAPEFGPFTLDEVGGTVGHVAGINDNAVVCDPADGTYLSASADSTTDVLAGGRVSAWSLAFWFRALYDNTSVIPLIVKAQSIANSDYTVRLIAATQWQATLSVGVDDDAVPHRALQTGITLEAVHLVVASIDYGLQRIGLSVDGAEIEWTSTPGLQPVATMASLRVGGDDEAILHGWIDEIGKWDRALDFADIEALWNNGTGTTLTASGLEAWHLSASALTAGALQSTGLQARQLAVAVLGAGPQPTGLQARQLAAAVLGAGPQPTGLQARQLAVSILTARSKLDAANVTVTPLALVVPPVDVMSVDVQPQTLATTLQCGDVEVQPLALDGTARLRRADIDVAAQPLRSSLRSSDINVLPLALRGSETDQSVISVTPLGLRESLPRLIVRVSVAGTLTPRSPRWIRFDVFNAKVPSRMATMNAKTPAKLATLTAHNAGRMATFDAATAAHLTDFSALPAGRVN